MTRNEIITIIDMKGGEDYNSYAERAVPLLQKFNNGETYGHSKSFIEECRNRISEVIMEHIKKICSSQYRACKEYLDFEELFSTAYTKVFCRIDEFDPKKGKFSTFIKNDIIAAKRESFEGSNNTTHYEYKKNKIITNKANELASILDRRPELVRDEDIAFALQDEGISLKAVKQYRNIRINKNAISIDSDDCNLINKIADKDAYNLIYVNDIEDSFNVMFKGFDDIDLFLFLIMYDNSYRLSRKEVMRTDLYGRMYSQIHPSSKKLSEDNEKLYEKHVTHVKKEINGNRNGFSELYSREEFDDCLVCFIEKTRCEILDYLYKKYL